jgi:hypothetical protein
MKGKRFTEEQIIGVLKEYDAGAPTKELWRAATGSVSATRLLGTAEGRAFARRQRSSARPRPLRKASLE